MGLKYIEESKNIISILKAEGLEDHAQKVQDAMDSACVSTELLSGVCFYLEQVPLDKVSELTKKRIEFIIKEINGLLQK